MPVAETRRARVATCTLRGVETVPVTVEIEVGTGLPGMQIVGMGDTSVQEARQRVRSALRAAGFTIPANRHIVVNLAPASLRKTGSGFDLPIAVAFLIATGQIDPAAVENDLIVGELALEGAVRPVDGLFAYAICAQGMGRRLLSGPPRMTFPHLDGLDHRCIGQLGHLRDGTHAKVSSEPMSASQPSPDFCDVVGQEQAVRALTIAATGGHGVLMVGPPGSGKSMLARRLPSILPPLSEEERIEAALIHSVAGLDVSSIASGVRPFRSPHHSATVASLVGGGQPIMPGEASLAHHGVLYLDELGEFGNAALQALRQPLEDGRVSICRADGRSVFPAEFQLIAASNPCPCGYLGDREHACQCADAQIRRYKGKLGGPIKDRIDLICDVCRIDPSKVLDTGNGHSSKHIVSEVLAARERAYARNPMPIASPKASPREVIELCGLGTRQRRLVEEVSRRHRLSGRGVIRVLRVARTIADLESSSAVLEDHLLEALMFRVENELE